MNAHSIFADDKGSRTNLSIEQSLMAASVAHSLHQQRVIQQHAFHPTGEHIPVTEAELALTPLHRWMQMVARYPTNNALEEVDRSLTYAQVNALANRIAHAILGHELPGDRPIALLLGLEWDLPPAILAVWKAGHFFVWLEPNQPLARLQYMVEESEAPIVVTNRAYAESARQLWAEAHAILVLDELDPSLPDNDPPIAIQQASPAYLMYTSGSTGKPKAVLELHRNIMQMMMERTNPFHFGTHDRVALLMLGGGCHTILCAWMYGGTLLPFNAKAKGLVRLSNWIVAQRITLLLDAALLRTWLLSLDGSSRFPSVRIVILGAGPTFREHVEAFQRYLPEHCILANLYASTEVRSISLMLMDRETRLENRLVPVGFAPAWAKIEIWDEQDQPLPTGSVGEIVVLTPYAAAGYWKSPELTATKFGVDASGRAFCRMGDLGRLDEQGCLWVLGRKDGQIKIRSNRVESAEVEVALLELPHVKEAAILAEGDSDEDRRLVAFVAAPSHLTGIELRRQLATRLPDYMVPSIFVVLDELPHTANGKINRPALRASLKRTSS